MSADIIRAIPAVLREVEEHRISSHAALELLGVTHESSALDTGHADFIAQQSHPAIIPFADLTIYAPSHVYHPWPQSSTHLMRQAIGASPCQAAILEIGCGTGAVGLSLAPPDAGNELTLSDNDPAALAAAEINAMANERFARVVKSDLFSAFETGRQWDLIVFNAPLLFAAPGGLCHAMAIDTDGKLIKRFMHELPARLKPAGSAYVAWAEGQGLDLPVLAEKQNLTTQVRATDRRGSGIVVNILEVKHA
ncbi:hypothetical protein BI364_07245 [Acidihalobacter yilgarnensis]|uniref:Methyltransferase small domain-containing protein n=1 Tax=Acidihalobacter yilgarnensis TaxID=2819280 RepID=A0A1D8IMT4_9GAMM|nr:hypothetical protein BI364_07245 [Acidihalobacter yilgarnensis]